MPDESHDCCDILSVDILLFDKILDAQSITQGTNFFQRLEFHQFKIVKITIPIL